MKYPLKKYEIWIGYYHFGQGCDPSTQPQMVAEIEAPNFKIACFIYELRTTLQSIEDNMNKDEYIDNPPARWCYDVYNNYNIWTGKYFETEQEAIESFKVK